MRRTTEPQTGRMPPLDVVDDTFVVASRADLMCLCDERTWVRWFPAITLTCTQDRGLLGKRWTMTGELVGTAEVWLQQHADGVLVHTYLRQVSSGRSGADERFVGGRLRRRYARTLKAHLFACKDDLERGRPPGEPRTDEHGRVVSAAGPDASAEGVRGA